MENNTSTPIQLNYSGSGVRALKCFSIICFVLGIILFAACLIFFVLYLTDKGMVLYGVKLAGLNLVYGVAALFQSFFMFGLGVICRGIASIAETALIQKAVLLAQKPTETAK